MNKWVKKVDDACKTEKGRKRVRRWGTFLLIFGCFLIAISLHYM